MRIDLNCDLGESFGQYKIGNDEQIMKYISSANIACGFHAGDPLTMRKTIDLAIKNNVAIGAHPGFPDLVGFGRRNMDIDSTELEAILIYQIGALKTMTESAGAKLQHVKPHGALYNMAAINEEIAQCIVNSIKAIDCNLILMGLANSKMKEMAEVHNITFASEVFADRNYKEDGTLVPRKQQNAIIHESEESLKHVERMIKENKVKSISDKLIPIKVDSICLHGDNIKALEFAERLYLFLKEENIEIMNLRK